LKEIEKLCDSVLFCFSFLLVSAILNDSNYICSDDWEIPFENISDLEWLGSGAQGAVFVGRYAFYLFTSKSITLEQRCGAGAGGAESFCRSRNFWADSGFVNPYNIIQNP
jgi:hypothetical protein